MPNPFPYYQFYPDDWDSNSAVRCMSFAERGLYISLLNLQWRDGTVPDDPAKVARILGVTLAEVSPLWATVRLRFEETDTGLRNLRMQTEREKAENRGRKLSEAGHQGGVNSRKHTKPGLSIASESVSVSVSVSGSSVVSSPEEKTSTPAREVFDVSPWALKLRSLHPARKCALSIVEEKLHRIVDKLTPDESSTLLDFIVSQHAAMCASWDWTKEHHSFCKSLEAWLSPARKLWENAPVNPTEPMPAMMTAQERNDENRNEQHRRMLKRAADYDRDHKRQGVLQ